MRIALITDAWFPQINGVVRTLSRVKQELEEMGHELEVIAPTFFAPCPARPIRKSAWPLRRGESSAVS